MKKRGKTRDMLEYLAARAGHALLAPWPPELTARFVRGIIGPVLYATLRRARQHGLAHLDRAFGTSLSCNDKKRLLRQLFGHLAENAVEFFFYSGPSTEPTPFLMDDESRRVFESVRGGGEPVIFVTGHLGNWEIFGLTGGGFPLPLNTVARPLDNTRLDRWVKSRREAGLQKMCPTKGAPAVLSAALRRREAVVLLVDQNQRKHGVFVDFFGFPAGTTRTPALLSLRAGAPVIPACLVREAKPFRFRALFAPPIYPKLDRPVESEIQRITQAFTTTLENWIRRYPDQWLWCHRRWRTQPVEHPEKAPSLTTIQPGGRIFARVSVVERHGRKAILKDFSRSSLLFRSTVGAMLVGHEARAYRRLEGLPGVPRLLDRPDRQALLLEYVPGRNCLEAPEQVFSQAFFDHALVLLQAVRARGVLHFDVAGNLMIDSDGKPFLVDFGSCLILPKWFSRGYFSDLRRKYDERALLKLKRRRAPQLLGVTEAEKSKEVLPFEGCAKIVERLLRRTVMWISGGSGTRHEH